MEVRNPQSGCPRAAEVERSLVEPLGEEALASLAAHLDACETCRKRAMAEPKHAALQDDLRWADTAQAQTSVDVSVPLARLSELLGGEYEIIAEIGRGGMGIVYQARQIELDRMVALKVLPALLGIVRPDAMGRFRREAALAARLKHTNIIAVHDFGQVEGTLYYAMELVEGRSLRNILREIDETGAIDAVLGAASDPPSAIRQKEGAPSPQVPDPQSTTRSPQSAIGLTRLGSSSRADRAYYLRVATWMSEVGEALDYAHERGVIHRDIKPSNLLLAGDGRLMIADFGLARSSDLETMTTSRSLLGTARYMSPEQVDQEAGPIDRRSDVYALGATLYELLAFRPMFTAADDREVLDQVLNREPTPPHKLVRQVPQELETICLKAVEKDRVNRYDTAKALADDLRRWLLDLPIHARRPSLPVRARKFVRRRKLPVALAAVSAVLLLATGFIYAAYSSSHREATEVRSVAALRRIQILIQEARTQLDEGRFGDALEKATVGLADQPDSVNLQRLRARALQCLDRHGEARAILEEILVDHPDDWQSHYHIALALCDLERPGTTYYSSQALRRLSREVKERRLPYHSQQVHRLHPDSAESFVLLAAAESDPHRAIELLNEALERCPTMGEALLDRSRRFEQIGDYEAMLLDTERATTKRFGWAPIQAQRASALCALGRYSEAEQAYTEVIQRNPRHASCWHHRGLVRCRLGRFAEALADADEAVRLDPDFAYGYACRARAQVGLGRLNPALSDYERAHELLPGDIEILHDRAKVYVDIGQVEEAIVDMTRAIELAPDDVRAYNSRAICYMLGKRYDRALGDLTRCIELDPANVKAHRNRAYAHSMNNQHNQSIADYSRALELEPDIPGVLSSRAGLFFRIGHYEEAIADLTRLIEIQAAPGKSILQRGMSYELAGAVRLALADYGRLCEQEGPVGDYARLWKGVLLGETGRTGEAAEVFASHKRSTAGTSWTDRLFDLFAGNLTPEELLAAAVTDNERAEAYYYAARRAFLDGRFDAAREAFANCVGFDRRACLEPDIARARLKTLEEDSAKLEDRQ